MPENNHTDMISSKEIISQAGISRATLNNYIALGLIPAPTLKRPLGPGAPTKLGYFPAWVLDRLAEIKRLKAEGCRLAEIRSRLGVTTAGARMEAIVAPEAAISSYECIDRLVFPALLVNQRWEIVWINGAAERELFKGEKIRDIPEAGKRNLLRLLVAEEHRRHLLNWEDVARAHMQLAKEDISRGYLEALWRDVAGGVKAALLDSWAQMQPPPERPLRRLPLALLWSDGSRRQYSVFSSEFREGTLLLYTPANMQLEQILRLLTGRERLIKTILAQRLPSLTPLGVIAVRLESSLHLRTALPPHEYFDLVNQFGLLVHGSLRAHGGTPGRAFDEGAVGFFLGDQGEPGAYLFDCLVCATHIRNKMRELSSKWKYRRVWGERVFVNIGLHCGQEWIGTVPSSLTFEFTVLGNTLHQARSLCVFAAGGSIWASKKVIENLAPKNRQRLKYGIRRGPGTDGFISTGIYSRIRELVTPEEIHRRGLEEIENLPVAEIFEIDAGE